MPANNVNRNILLISNSTLHGSGFLDHAEAEIRDFLGEVTRLLFVPFALHDQDGYASKVKDRLGMMGCDVEWIHQMPDKQKAVMDTKAMFIGLGNSFRLLKSLYEFDLLDLIRERVNEGMLYMGSSAGANVAAPTIRTTNDMPIVEPPSLNALGLVSYQINPHYLDPDPDSKHMGETREERIVQFLEENETTVVGLREGAMLRIADGTTTLKGSTGARIFRREHEPVEVLPVANLSELLA